MVDGVDGDVVAEPADEDPFSSGIGTPDGQGAKEETQGAPDNMGHLCQTWRACSSSWCLWVVVVVDGGSGMGAPQLQNNGPQNEDYITDLQEVVLIMVKDLDDATGYHDEHSCYEKINEE